LTDKQIGKTTNKLTNLSFCEMLKGEYPYLPSAFSFNYPHVCIGYICSNAVTDRLIMCKLTVNLQILI